MSSQFDLFKPEKRAPPKAPVRRVKRSLIAYNGIDIGANGEMICLTDMWRAVGSPEMKRPSRWRENEATKAFVEYIACAVGKNDNEVFQVLRHGSDVSTWAHSLWLLLPGMPALALTEN